MKSNVFALVSTFVLASAVMVLPVNAMTEPMPSPSHVEESDGKFTYLGNDSTVFDNEKYGYVLDDKYYVNVLDDNGQVMYRMEKTSEDSDNPRLNASIIRKKHQGYDVDISVEVFVMGNDNNYTNLLDKYSKLGYTKTENPLKHTVTFVKDNVTVEFFFAEDFFTVTTYTVSKPKKEIGSAIKREKRGDKIFEIECEAHSYTKEWNYKSLSQKMISEGYTLLVSKDHKDVWIKDNDRVEIYYGFDAVTVETYRLVEE